MNESLRHLRKHREFAQLIKKHGPPDLKRYHGRERIFTAILRSIISQQISTSAARSIRERFLKLFPKSGPTPELLLQSPIETLRAAGLSTQKVYYMRDAAEKFNDSTVNPKNFSRMTSDEITEHLVQIKGVGVWTAHMLLIFTLNRPDTLPVGDLGIKKGFQKVYKLRTLPSPTHMERLAKPWRAHASVASWYLWRAADEAKTVPKRPLKKLLPPAKLKARRKRHSPRS